MAQGALTLKSFATTSGNTYGVVASPDGKNVYAMVVSGTNGVQPFSVNSADGSLTNIGSVVPTASQPRHGAFSPDGVHLYVCVTGYDQFIVMKRAADGTLTQIATYTTGVSSPVYSAVSPDGAHVYVTNSTNGTFQVYSRDSNSGSGTYGKLTLLQTVSQANAFGIALTPDGTGVYVSSTNSLVYSYTRDNNSASGTYGKLTPVNSYATASGFANAVGISSDSKFVYVLSDSGSNVTSCFTRTAGDNTLSQCSTFYPPSTTDNNKGNWDIALTYDNTGGVTPIYGVYWASSDGQRVAQLSRDSGSGVLTSQAQGSVFSSNYVTTSQGSGGPYGVCVLPNNKYLYATNTSGRGVDVYSIDQGTGVAGTVSQDTLGFFSVLNTVSQNFASSFSVLSAVSQDFASSFSMLGAVSQDFASNFTIAAASSSTVSQDFASSFNVLNLVSRDFASSFNVSSSSADNVVISAANISAARKVVFPGGAHVVTFAGGTKTVRF